MQNCWSLDVQKVKNNSVSFVANEIFRRYLKPSVRENVDPSRTKNNKTIYGNSEVVANINQKIKDLHLPKVPRKDANSLVVFCMQPSPWWIFDCLKTPEDIEIYENLKWQNEEDRPKIQEIWKSINEEKVKAFEEVVKDFAKKELGDDLLYLVCHRDEKCIHYQMGAFPKVGKAMSCKQYYNPKNLREWRKNLGLKFAKLGLVEHQDPAAPGVHLDLDEYHELPNHPKIEPPSVKVPPAVTETQVFKTNWFGKQQIMTTEQVLLKTQEREKEQGKKYKFYKNFHKDNESKVRKVDKLLLENQKLKEENKKMKTQAKKFYEEKTEKLREIPCEDVLSNLGYEVRKEGSGYRAKNDDFNIFISNGNKFYDNQSSAGGFGAISLLVDILKYSFKDAISYLANGYGADRTTDTILSSKVISKAVIETSVDNIVSEMPKPVSKNIGKITDYLINKRKISKTLIDELLSKDMLFADRNNNCVFTNKDKTFGFQRGITDKKFVSCKGKMDFIKYDFGNPKEVYLFESAIDALSFRTMNPEKDGSYVVLNGSALINRTHEITDKADKVFLCFDNDEQGTKFCDKLSSVLVSPFEIIKPVSKDFNEDLANGNYSSTQRSIDLGTGNSKTRPRID